MRLRPYLRLFNPLTPLPACLLAALALTACGGGSDSVSSQATTPVATTTPITPVTPVTPITPVTPVTPPSPVATGTAVLSGVITSDQPSVASFTPKTSDDGKTPGLTTIVGTISELYLFNSGNVTINNVGTTVGAPQTSYQFTAFRGQLQSLTYTETSFERGVARRVARSCFNGCAGGLSSSKTTSGQGIVINVKDVRLTYDALSSTAVGASTAVVTVNGSVTGEFESGYVFTSQLPRGSGGVLAVSGAGEPASQSLLYSQAGYPGSGADADQFPSLEIFTSGGALTVRRNQGVSAANQYFVNYQPADTNKPAFSGFATPAVYSETATDFTVNLNGLTLSTTSGTRSQVVVSGSLNVGKPSGVVSATGETDFKPTFSSVGGTNETLVYDFRGNLPAGINTIPSVSVQIKRGVVSSFLSTSNSGKLYSCDGTISNQFTAKCSGTVTLSADRRSLTFTDFKASLNLDPTKPITYNGTLVASGQ